MKYKLKRIKPAYKRHDMSNDMWLKLAPHLPGQPGQHGGIAHNNRKFINGVMWIIRTGAPWRDLPPSYGNWNSIAKRFRRWVKAGIWEQLLEILIEDKEYEWLLLDTSHVKVHPHGCGAAGGNQDMGRTKGGLTPKYIWPWMRMVVSSESLLHQVPRLTAQLQFRYSTELTTS